MPNRRTTGDSARPPVRLAVAERDSWTCQLCGTPVHNNDPRSPTYMHAGHILDHADGGRPTIDNLRCECRLCNQKNGGTNTVNRTRSTITALQMQNEQLLNTIAAMNADAPITHGAHRASPAERDRNAKPVGAGGFSDGPHLSGRSRPPVSNSEQAALNLNGGEFELSRDIAVNSALSELNSRAVIVLWGPPGAGKSTIARELSRRYSVPVFDRDEFNSNEEFDSQLRIVGADNDARAIVIRTGIGARTRALVRVQVRSTVDRFVDAPDDVLLQRIAGRDGEVSAYARRGVERWRAQAGALADTERFGGGAEVVARPAPGRHSSPADFSGVPWMGGLLRIPADATWPRFMSGPHPLAVGSYGQRFERWWKANPWSPRYRTPRWWQRLVARRVLEHDAAGNLVWDEWLLTLARQLGKSVVLQGLALWRMDVAPKLFGEPAEVLHVANKIKISREIQAPARAWARARADLGWGVREMAGSEAVTHPNGSRWQCAAQGSTYGFTASVAMIDEAWEIDADTVTNGIEPTVLERAAHQLGLISTAHPNATNLFVDRRRDAMAGDDVLLIEWSAPPWLPDEDRAGWRMASPSWTAGRERAIGKALTKARTQPPRPGEPDPIKSWRAQYLNQWPEKAADMLGLSGERLLPEGSWADLAADVDTVGDLAIAIEDHAGLATAVSVAGATADGRIGVNGFSLASRDDAFAFVTAVVQAQSVQAVFIGPALVDVGDVELLRPLVRIEAVNAADTKGALALLRQLCSRREVAHPVGVDLDGQVDRCRVVAGPAGLRIVSIDRFDLVKSAAWAVAAIERQRQFAPTVY
jgi:HNH endonuclease